MQPLPEGTQTPNVPPVSNAETANHGTPEGVDAVLATIEKLAALHSAGILTDEEFAEKKKELLAKI